MPPPIPVKKRSNANQPFRRKKEIYVPTSKRHCNVLPEAAPSDVVLAQILELGRLGQ
jgi:hypothetical protein